jgi:hypothetical protein
MSPPSMAASAQHGSGSSRRVFSDGHVELVALYIIIFASDAISTGTLVAPAKLRGGKARSPEHRRPKEFVVTDEQQLEVLSTSTQQDSRWSPARP